MKKQKHYTNIDNEKNVIFHQLCKTELYSFPSTGTRLNTVFTDYMFIRLTVNKHKSKRSSLSKGYEF